jgi:hypothetical protein
MAQTPPARPQPSVADLKDPAKFNSIISAIEAYSRTLLTNFDSTTKSLHDRLDNVAGVASQALTLLSQSESELEAILGSSFGDLDAIIETVEALAQEFNGLDAIEGELCLLSDQVTTLEDAVKRRQ